MLKSRTIKNKLRLTVKIRTVLDPGTDTRKIKSWKMEGVETRGAMRADCGFVAGAGECERLASPLLFRLYYPYLDCTLQSRSLRR